MKGTPFEVLDNRDGAVMLSNMYYDDGWNHCRFETREEVDKFILKLAKVRDKVFGKE